MANKNPKVSVCVVTYNQEKYIRQCLQSIVDQVTDFDFEVIVADDCSIDSTQEILKEFSDKYPSVIKLIFHKVNIGPYSNFVFVHQQALGEYIAHVDGDDYCLPGKLQAQANILDCDSSCNIVWHRMLVLSDNDTMMYEDNYSSLGLTKDKFYLDDVIANITIGLHSSKMYRSSCAFVLPQTTNMMLDFTANVFQLIEMGKYARFVSDVVYGVYRSNVGISKQSSLIRILIYRWLLHFYSFGITDPKFINGKIAWMLISDIRHKRRSFFYGLFAFIFTIRFFRLNKFWLVRARMQPTSIKHKLVSMEG
jgi:glycosyltransferase involved in cell wall biosynthesis